MAEKLIQDTTLTNMANAIRSKDGTSAPIQVSDFGQRILDIPTGTITINNLLANATWTLGMLNGDGTIGQTGSRGEKVTDQLIEVDTTKTYVLIISLSGNRTNRVWIDEFDSSDVFQREINSGEITNAFSSTPTLNILKLTFNNPKIRIGIRTWAWAGDTVKIALLDTVNAINDSEVEIPR